MYNFKVIRVVSTLWIGILLGAGSLLVNTSAYSDDIKKLERKIEYLKQKKEKTIQTDKYPSSRRNRFISTLSPNSS